MDFGVPALVKIRYPLQILERCLAPTIGGQNLIAVPPWPRFWATYKAHQSH